MASGQKHLLVFGASGVSGWACVKEALKFPTPTTFAVITGLTNRPLSIEDSHLPRDPRIQLISGIDLTRPVVGVTETMKAKIPKVETVTHVIFTAYIEKPDYESLRVVNTDLLKTAVGAIDRLATDLESVVLQTGGKAYGVEFPDKLELRPPFSESQPRIPKPYYDNIFYYTQHDAVKELSADRHWTFSEIRPDVIVGFTPGTNFMNAAQGLGIWLSIVRELYGEGYKVPFPGTQGSWKNRHTDTSQDILARMNIYAAVNHDKCGNGGIFNCADGDVVTWADKWPKICAFFGLEGAGPGAEPYSVEEFVKNHVLAWHELVRKHGLKEGIFEKYSWMFLHFVMAMDFDRQYDMSRIREVGFNESVETVEGWVTAFQRMRDAAIIP